MKFPYASGASIHRGHLERRWLYDKPFEERPITVHRIEKLVHRSVLITGGLGIILVNLTFLYTTSQILTILKEKKDYYVLPGQI